MQAQSDGTSLFSIPFYVRSDPSNLAYWGNINVKVKLIANPAGTYDVIIADGGVELSCVLISIKNPSQYEIPINTTAADYKLDYTFYYYVNYGNKTPHVISGTARSSSSNTTIAGVVFKEKCPVYPRVN